MLLKPVGPTRNGIQCSLCQLMNVVNAVMPPDPTSSAGGSMTNTSHYGRMSGRLLYMYMLDIRKTPWVLEPHPESAYTTKLVANLDLNRGCRMPETWRISPVRAAKGSSTSSPNFDV